jgi:hypothetical protein
MIPQRNGHNVYCTACHCINAQITQRNQIQSNSHRETEIEAKLDNVVHLAGYKILYCDAVVPRMTDEEPKPHPESRLV